MAVDRIVSLVLQSYRYCWIVSLRLQELGRWCWKLVVGVVVRVLGFSLRCWNRVVGVEVLSLLLQSSR